VDHDDLCAYCGKKGHWAREYHKKKRDEAGRAHVAQGEEEEQSLLLALSITTVVNPAPLPLSAVHHNAPSTPTAPCRIVHVEEQKVFADLGLAQEGNHVRWVLETGATNHMTGLRDIFTELDIQIRGTVKFGDGSVPKIEGRGSIVLACKNGGHRTLTGVYFIPRLRASIISLSQLNEIGCHIDINHRVLRIYDQHGQLLVKVQRDASRLYHLHLHLRQSVRLMT
jgi:hypothetical protein